MCVHVHCWFFSPMLIIEFTHADTQIHGIHHGCLNYCCHNSLLSGAIAAVPFQSSGHEKISCSSPCWSHICLKESCVQIGVCEHFFNCFVQLLYTTSFTCWLFRRYSHIHAYHLQKNWKTGENQSFFWKRDKTGLELVEACAICHPLIVNSSIHCEALHCL